MYKQQHITEKKTPLSQMHQLLAVFLLIDIREFAHTCVNQNKCTLATSLFSLNYITV